MSHTKNKTIIELYGLPGAGKSTLAKELEEKYQFTRIAVPYRSMSRSGIFLKAPKTFILWMPVILSVFLKNKSLAVLKYNFSLLFSSLEKIILAQQSTSEYVVLDEGLLQRFLSFSDVILSEKKMLSMIRKMPIGSEIVLVNNKDPETERYEGTSNIRSQQGTAYLAAWKENQSKQLAHLEVVLMTHFSEKHWTTRNTSLDAILKNIQSKHI